MYELSGVLVLLTGVRGFMERVSELKRGLVGIHFTHELGSLFSIAVPSICCFEHLNVSVISGGFI